MSGSINCRWSVDGVEDGAPWSAPETSIVRPVKTFASVNSWRIHKRLILPAWSGAPVPTLLFDAGAENQYNFQWLGLQLVGGTGFAHFSWLCDKPTSSSNLAPLGTHQRTNEVDWSCTFPFFLNTALARVHPTLATAAGISGGYPAILTDAGTVDGRIYKIWGKNQSTTTPIEVYVWAGN